MRDENKEKKILHFSKDGSIIVTDEVLNTVTRIEI